MGAARKKNAASHPTPTTATVIGRRRKAEGESEVVVAPRRVFECPGCAAEFVLEPAKAWTEGQPLHFPFKCPDCGYKAAMGVS